MTIKTADYSTLTHWLQEFTCMPAHTSFIFIQLVRHIIHSSNKIQNGYILVSVNPGPPGKWLLKQGKRERERERERERQTDRHRGHAKGVSTVSVLKGSYTEVTLNTVTYLNTGDTWQHANITAFRHILSLTSSLQWAAQRNIVCDAYQLRSQCSSTATYSAKVRTLTHIYQIQCTSMHFVWHRHTDACLLLLDF